MPTCAAAIANYNAYSPTTAQGTGLPSQIKITGSGASCRREVVGPGAFVVGQANIPITNGAATDANQNVWLLPASMMIPSGGSITVTLTAKNAQGHPPGGAYNRLRLGKAQSVTAQSGGRNCGTAGRDRRAAARNRQAVSTSTPSQTIVDGVTGALRNLPGVTRAAGYENNTATANSLGLPPRLRLRD